jgi:hypothetical protein
MLVLYADYSAAASNLEQLKLWWTHLCKVGPNYGYFPKPSKKILIVKKYLDKQEISLKIHS